MTIKILVTNDDGWQSEGIKVLQEVAAEFGNVVVVAPEENYSGASSSLTLTDDIRICRRNEQLYTVDGTPTDCTHLAMTGNLLPMYPDVVVSGINSGSNMGDDTIYSGTVAAAMEGYLFGVSSLAFSMAGACGDKLRYETGGIVVRRLLQRFCQTPPREPVFLNVNVPNIAPDNLRGIQQTRLGRRHAAEPSIHQSTDGNISVYKIGEAGKAMDGGFGTDFYAIENNYASVTPLTTDLTAFAKMGELAQWLAD